MKQARLGNPQAVEALVAANANAAFTLAMRILRHRENAEETVQDAFIKAFGALHRFRGESRFSTWLHRIVYTTALNRAARKEPMLYNVDHPGLAENDMGATTEQFNTLELADRQHYTSLALGKLAPEERGLLVLHYYEDKPLAEVAEIAGLTRANVKVKLYRARQKMAHELKALLGDELPIWKS